MKFPPPIAPIVPRPAPPPRAAPHRGDAAQTSAARQEQHKGALFGLAEIARITASDGVFAMAAGESPTTDPRAGDEASADDDASAQRRDGVVSDAPLAPALDDAHRRLRRVGTLAGQLFRHSTAQGCWSARIPVDPELLPATVLLLGYGPMQASVHFETQDWETRALLRDHCRQLETFLREQLPANFEVSVSA